MNVPIKVNFLLLDKFSKSIFDSLDSSFSSSIGPGGSNLTGEEVNAKREEEVEKLFH